jgi:hypothetical protein
MAQVLPTNNISWYPGHLCILCFTTMNSEEMENERCRKKWILLERMDWPSGLQLPCSVWHWEPISRLPGTASGNSTRGSQSPKRRLSYSCLNSSPQMVSALVQIAGSMQTVLVPVFADVAVMCSKVLCTQKSPHIIVAGPPART